LEGLASFLVGFRKGYLMEANLSDIFSRVPGFDGEVISGKRILITGGTTGIGRAIALLLASQGATVMIFGRHEQELNDAMAALRNVALSTPVYGFTADIAHEEGVTKVFRQVDEQMNGLDVLINNAGLAFEGIDKGSYADWQYVVNTNLLGYMACSREAVIRMEKNNRGHILFIGSMSVEAKRENSSVYTATKAAVRAFSETFRKEVNKLNIKVSLIEPGLVASDMIDVPPEKHEEMQQKGEMLKAVDIAMAVFYILIQPWRCNIMTTRILPDKQQ
jgi:NADP-dependent 3-hydroxy acid dehydrogenase YdfG